MNDGGIEEGRARECRKRVQEDAEKWIQYTREESTKIFNMMEMGTIDGRSLKSERLSPNRPRPGVASAPDCASAGVDSLNGPGSTTSVIAMTQKPSKP